jgi:hypothetical protein
MFLLRGVVLGACLSQITLLAALKILKALPRLKCRQGLGCWVWQFLVDFPEIVATPWQLEKLDIAGPWMTTDYMCY